MNDKFKREIKNKKILVTGGTGSIGSLIVRELLKCEPHQVRVFSRDESKQFELAQELGLGDSPRINFLIGDIRDKERLNMAMENIDMVFHTAALKHVAACEKNPFEAVKTNIQGTQNIIDCAFANKVDKVIGISTDKATDPTNVMGCTKLLAEKMMLATFFYKGSKKTKFCFVRFGNVMGSRGSVLPLFLRQARAGGSLTVTDPDMTRFFMSVSQAVDLIFKAAVFMQDREIFILKMPSVKITDLAKAAAEIIQRQNNFKDRISIKIIGKKDGEKIHEKLLTKDESEIALETKDMFIITPNFRLESSRFKSYTYAGASKAKIGEYSSEKQPKLSVEEIKRMIKNCDVNC